MQVSPFAERMSFFFCYPVFKRVTDASLQELNAGKARDSESYAHTTERAVCICRCITREVLVRDTQHIKPHGSRSRSSNLSV